MTELQILEMAKKLVREHGMDAHHEAAKMATDALNEGDMIMVENWRQVLKQVIFLCGQPHRPAQ